MRIRLRRALVGTTQEDLARTLGISYQQLQKYETAGNPVSTGRLYEIAQTLSVEMSCLFEDLEDGLSDSQQVLQVHGGTQRSTIDIAQKFLEYPEPGVEGLCQRAGEERRPLARYPGSLLKQASAGNSLIEWSSIQSRCNLQLCSGGALVAASKAG